MEGEEEEEKSARKGDGYTKGSAYIYKGRLFFSGGACLKKNSASESNQIYQFVPNTRVLLLDDGEEHDDMEQKEDTKEEEEDAMEKKRWRLLLDLDYFSSKFQKSDYSVIAVFPTDVTLSRCFCQTEVCRRRFLADAASSFQAQGSPRSQRRLKVSS